MSDTKAERLADALNDFIASSPDVEAAAVVSFDGLAMASALPPDMDEDRLGAMSAALLSLGEQAAGGLGRGELSQVFVEGEHGFVVLMSARDEAVLATVTSRRAKIGLMLYEMRHAADAVGAVLEARPEPAAPAPEAAVEAGGPQAPPAPVPPAPEPFAAEPEPQPATADDLVEAAAIEHLAGGPEAEGLADVAYGVEAFAAPPTALQADEPVDDRAAPDSYFSAGPLRHDEAEPNGDGPARFASQWD